MSGQVRRSLVLALAGLLGGLGLVAALFGGESLRRLTGRDAAEPPAAAAPVPQDGLRALADPGMRAKGTDPAIDFRNDAPKDASKDASGTAKPGPAGQGPAAGPAGTGPSASPGPRSAGSGTPAAGPTAEPPRFDIVRVEPNGDAVVAGRGAPHAEVEMLVDGKPVARAKADPNGQFAIVPPALPTGASTLQLRTIAKDGQAASSQQSVAVNVAPGRDRQPLVALTAPDAATVVLSQPGAPGPAAPPARTADAAPGRPAAGEGRAAHPSAALPGAAHPGPAQPTRIVSVDVQGTGRLFVTAAGTPGAAVRLYLNDTLIAPGTVGPDGRASFTIGRGVKPGQYQVRIDQIDPATGKVASRAEVPLSVPEPAPVAARAPAAPSGGPGTPREAGRATAQAGAQSGTQAGAPGSSQPGAKPSAQPNSQDGSRMVSQAAPQTGPEAGSEAGRAAGPPASARPPGQASSREAAREGPQERGAEAPGRSAAAAPSETSGATGGDPGGDPGGAASRLAAETGGPARAGVVFVPEISTAKITRGDNLWRISQRTYGRGERYTVIYDANQDQIRDPDLIYPGQIFVLPPDKRG